MLSFCIVERRELLRIVVHRLDLLMSKYAFPES